MRERDITPLPRSETFGQSGAKKFGNRKRAVPARFRDLGTKDGIGRREPVPS